MGMHNPPHPGEFIREIYLAPYDISVRQVAKNMKVSSSTLNRLLRGESNVSPQMALRLSKVVRHANVCMDFGSGRSAIQ